MTAWSEEVIFAKLKAQYNKNEWVLLPQVRRATGTYAVRTADAVAMNAWRSRGLVVHGFEFKSRRSDWIRELKDPLKQEEGIYKFCDMWYIVAGDPDIVKPEEVPAPWGFARPEGEKLKIVKKAPRLKPDTLDRAFIASVLRNIRDRSGISDTILQKKIDEGMKLGRKMALAQQNVETQQWKNQYDQLKGLVNEFEQTSGIAINHWNMGNVGEIVKLLRTFRPTEVLQRSKQIWDHELTKAQQQVTRLERALDQIKDLETRMAETRKQKQEPRSIPSGPH